MGRKIPGRKHRGVRDPEKQQAERFARIRDKINAPPSDPDEQQIPSSLTRIMELKNRVKQGYYSGKKRKTPDGTQPVKKVYKGRPEKSIPKFEQLPGETDRQFKLRADKICHDYLREVKFEDKYRVDVKRNEAGEVEGVVKRPKDELEELVKKLKREKQGKKKKGKKSKGVEQPKLTKSQKWALKLKQKKARKRNDQDQERSFVPLKESVKFGEVVHAPPSLTVPKKVDKLQEAPRPGRKPLLLKSMLSQEAPQSEARKISRVSQTSKNLSKKGKRKDMPHALRRQLEKQQKEVIDAYKALKAQKYGR